MFRRHFNEVSFWMGKMVEVKCSVKLTQIK